MRVQDMLEGFLDNAGRDWLRAPTPRGVDHMTGWETLPFALLHALAVPNW